MVCDGRDEWNMIYKKEKWWKKRLYEFYFQIERTCLYLGVMIADVDFEIHLTNLRGVRDSDG